MSTDTPRTNGFEIVVEGESPVMGNRYRAWAIFSRTLERELAAARLDTERLDWLENGGVSFDYDPGFPAVGFDGNYGPEPGQPPFWGAHINQKGLAMAATLRAAIDAARKATP